MKVLGIPLRKPTSGELTGAAVMAVGLWLAALGLLRLTAVEIGRADAGALLLVIAWGCVSARLGIRVDRGRRHLAANLLVSGALLACYHGSLAISG